VSTLKNIRIAPQTFALDEKTNQGLVVFETLKERTKFSVHLGGSVEIGLFLNESFKRQESGFVLSKKILEAQNLEIKKGQLTELNGEREEVHLFLKDPKKEKGLKKIKMSLLEILGLWTLENFPLYANKNFIENCRDIKIEVKETSNPLKSDLHKRYGQKYLM
jgi:hypothetical protein